MTSFGWKRKIGQKVKSSQPLTGFIESEQTEEPDVDPDFDWITLAKQKRFAALEDNKIKFDRLKNEGVSLAECGKFWQAIGRWDEALSLDPRDAVVHEMKAQALVQLHEWLPAIQAATRAVERSGNWAEAHQTLGRAQLGLGEVKLAVRSFSVALHLNPADEELRQEDLSWAVKLKEEYRKLASSEETLDTVRDNSALIARLGDCDSEDGDKTTDKLVKIRI